MLAGEGAVAGHLSSVAALAASFSRRGGGLFIAAHGCQAINAKNVIQAAKAAAAIANSQGRRLNGRGSNRRSKAESLAFRSTVDESRVAVGGVRLVIEWRRARAEE
ncbi:MAG TPA: hypothetical protein VMV10_31290 [Pirellulales bacterium]|nr:hypothetical protein [Pirellulales bacterium]